RAHRFCPPHRDGQPIRVACGFCHSEPNYRGGPRLRPSDFGGPAAHGVTSGAPVRPPAGTAAPSRWTAAGQTPAAAAARSRVPSDKEPFPIVSERERTGPAMPLQGSDDLELLLRRVIREDTAISEVATAE